VHIEILIVGYHSLPCEWKCQRKKKCCTLLEFIDSTNDNWLFGKDIVTGEYSSTIVDPFIMDNQFNSPVIIEINTAEVPPTISLSISLVLKLSIQQAHVSSK